MAEKEALKRPVLGIIGAVTATGLLIILFYSTKSPITPYISYFFAAYLILGIVAIFGVPIFISYRYNLIWAGWTLMTLLILLILALIIDPVSTVYAGLFIYLFWPATLVLYAIASGIEIASKRP